MKFILLIFITAGFKIARSPLLYARSYRLSIRLLIPLHKTADKMLLVTHSAQNAVFAGKILDGNGKIFTFL